MRSKYNWDKIKIEYFKSKYIQVKEFRENSYPPYTDRVCKNTSGRRAEKKQLISNAKTEAIKDLKEKLKESYKPSAKEMGNLHRLIVGVMGKKIVDFVNKSTEVKDDNGKVVKNDIDLINIGDLRTLWTMVKAEKLEPTSVGQIEGLDQSNNTIVVSKDVGDLIGIKEDDGISI